MEISFSEPISVKARSLRKRKESSTSKIILGAYIIKMADRTQVGIFRSLFYCRCTYNGNSVEYQDPDESNSNSDIKCKRQIHCKIEKRRRDKMNTYITQLSTMLPSCNFTAHKLDRITVLRMAVQYLKSIRNSPIQSNIEENLKYSFISDVELKKLILQVSEGFLFVVGCDSGKLLYVSESVSTILNCNQSELLGRSLYDVIHPSDIDKVKEQISCADVNPRHKLMTLISVKELDMDLPGEQIGLHPGNRRSFFFRIKSDIEDSELVSLNNADQNQYNIIHCVGYLKRWTSTTSSENSKHDNDDISSLTCLIAVGRTLNNVSQTSQIATPSKFVSKHTVDGKFLFVDDWITLMTGYLPQEILGTNIYEYIHSEDVNQFAEAHRAILQPFNCSIKIKNYRFRTKFNGYINIQSEWKMLQNPWKKDVEYFYSTNVIKLSNEPNDEDELYRKESNDVHNVNEELFMYPNYVAERKNEQNLIDDFNFYPTLCEKNNNETTMEAIMKILESDSGMPN